MRLDGALLQNTCHIVVRLQIWDILLMLELPGHEQGIITCDVMQTA